MPKGVKQELTNDIYSLIETIETITALVNDIHTEEDTVIDEYTINISREGWEHLKDFLNEQKEDLDYIKIRVGKDYS